MAKKPVKKPEYPEESRICGLIFICQLIAVLSAVSIVYLTVASYVPSIKAIASTYEEYPVTRILFLLLLLSLRVCLIGFADSISRHIHAFLFSHLSGYVHDDMGR